MSRHHEHPHRFSAEGNFIERLEGPERSALIPRDDVISRTNLRKREILVDLGSGVGYFSLPLASRVKTVISIDVEPMMHEVLSARIRDVSASNIELIRADITSLPMSNGSVDHVLAAFVYHEVGDPSMLLAESARVLRRSGFLTLVDFQKKETPIGPPVSERKTPEEVIKKASREFELEQRHEADVYYQLIFSPKRKAVTGSLSS